MELAVTPTAVSHQIKLLEQHCGQALFRRRPRPIALTEAGATLYPVIRDGLDAFADAVLAISRTSTQRVLRLTTTNAFASKWLVPRLTHWRETRPDIALEVIGTDTVLDLRKSEADMAIRYMRSPPTDFVSHELFRDAFVAVCHPDLLPSGKPLRALSDLSGQTLIPVSFSTLSRSSLNFFNTPLRFLPLIWAAFSRFASFTSFLKLDRNPIE